MSKTTSLGAVAEIGLGFKSLQNEFFYLSAETIETFGIEPQFLHPIFKIKDFDISEYRQEPPASLFVFTCRDEESELKGTGALKYIRVMAGRSANAKKQAAGGETISQVLAKQGGKYWYAPKASRTPSKIWMRKAFGGVFAPFICSEPLVVDQRCNYVLPKPGYTDEEVAALLTSSVLAYSIEVNGSISMGAGVLEAPTTKIREYPSPSMESWSKEDRRKLTVLGRKVWDTEKPVDWAAGETPGPLLSALDEFLVGMMPGGVSTAELHRDLSSAVLARHALASGKTGTRAKRKVEGLQSVSKGVADSIRGLLEVRRYPEGFISDSAETALFNAAGRQVGTIESFPMLGETELVIGFEGSDDNVRLVVSEPVAHVVTRALLLGRTEFEYPIEEIAARSVISNSTGWLGEIAHRLEVAVGYSAAGSGYEDSVASQVLRLLAVHPEAFQSHLPQKIRFRAGQDSSRLDS